MHILIMPTAPRGGAGPAAAPEPAENAEGSVPVVREGSVAFSLAIGGDRPDARGAEAADEPSGDLGNVLDRGAPGQELGSDRTMPRVAALVPGVAGDALPEPEGTIATLPAGIGNGDADVPVGLPQGLGSAATAASDRAAALLPPRGPMPPPAHASAPAAPVTGPDVPTAPDGHARDPGPRADPPVADLPRSRAEVIAAAPVPSRARGVPMAETTELPVRLEQRLRATTTLPASAAPPGAGALAPVAVPVARPAFGGLATEGTGRVAAPDLLGVFEDPAAAPDLRPGDRLGAERVFPASGLAAADRGGQTPAALARAVSTQLAEAVRLDPGRPVEIRLEPQELGQVRMTLSLTDQGVTVAMTVERPETLDLIRRHVDMLAQDFARLGLGTAGFSFARQDGGGAAAPGTPVPAGHPVQEPGGETDPALRIKLGAPGDGGMDIRL